MLFIPLSLCASLFLSPRHVLFFPSFSYCVSHLNPAHESVHCPEHRVRSNHHILVRFPRDIVELPLFGYDALPGTRDPWRRDRADPLDLEHHQVLVGQGVLWVLKTWRNEYVMTAATQQLLSKTFISVSLSPCGPGRPGSPLPPG